MDIELITEKILSLLKNKSSIIIAVDGFCASGKTTLSSALEKSLDCNIFHADDFFLRPEQRTPERLREIGGNMDRERLLSEVILPLKSEKAFSYRPFLCHSQKYGDEINITPKRISIIEGSYSCHPMLSDYYDLKLFITVSQKEQRQRILKRNPEKAEMFFQRWIPLENEYFSSFKIMEKADIVL